MVLVLSSPLAEACSYDAIPACVISNLLYFPLFIIIPLSSSPFLFLLYARYLLYCPFVIHIPPSSLTFCFSYMLPIFSIFLFPSLYLLPLLHSCFVYMLSIFLFTYFHHYTSSFFFFFFIPASITCSIPLFLFSMIHIHSSLAKLDKHFAIFPFLY